MRLGSVLIANRGEIALRVIRACKAMGIESVLAVSSADRDTLGAQVADRTVCIGPARVAESYLNQDALLATALGTKVDAIHPGYGFLSENSSFVQACEDNEIIFVGPSAQSVRSMGNKLAAREIAKKFGVPIVPGSPRIASFEDARDIASQVGYPVLFKAAGGGGGRGIRIVHEESQLKDTFQSASAEAEGAFGDGTLYIEKYISNARHIEIQVFGDEHGNAIHFGERDCSMQRRYQKIIEEAPAVIVPEATRAKMRDNAIDLVKGISYRNAGTIEFVYDVEKDDYYFLEMNTRIQVEHPVTESTTGIDLVQLQLDVAAGFALPLQQSDVTFTGHAIECRINAESPRHSFRPSPGKITCWQPPTGAHIRLDTHCYEGYVVPPFYDSMLAKLIISGSDRLDTIRRTTDALAEFKVEGIETNIEFLSFLVSHNDFASGVYNTRWVEANLSKFVP